MLTILFDGIAYGMLLFVLACGLSVTLGLMNFINLAHGAFAMVGGYVTALLMERRGRPVPRSRCRRPSSSRRRSGSSSSERSIGGCTAPTPLDQVLFTIGLVFMAMPIASFFLGSEPWQVHLPAWLSGSFSFHGVGDQPLPAVHRRDLRADRRGATILLVGTRFGAQLRASVDDQRVADGLGVNVGSIFSVAFSIGSGLAGLGGALAADVVGGIDPSFPVKFLVTFLIVVTVGGSNGILGALAGALLLGVLDVAGKYYVTLDRRLHHLWRDDRDADPAAAGPVHQGRRPVSGPVAQPDRGAVPRPGALALARIRLLDRRRSRQFSSFRRGRR